MERLMNVKKNKLRMGGNCHFHAIFNDGEFVGYASAGCQNPKNNEDLDNAYDEFYEAYGEGLFDYTICDIHEFNLIGVK